MNQKAISNKPKKTLGFKLLLGVSVIALALLSSSFGIVLKELSQDTRSITYELQSNQAQLTGLRFSSLVENVLDMLKTRSSFDGQRQIDAVEVFEFNAQASQPQRYFEWHSSDHSAPPTKEILAELLSSGIAYSARLNDRLEPSTDLYYLSESREQKDKLLVYRAKLNLTDIYQQAGGNNVQILDRHGQILFDSGNPVNIGKMKSAQDALFARAKKSPVSLGTLEFNDSDTGERTLGTYVLSGFKAITIGGVRFVDAMSGTYLLLERIILVGFVLLGMALIVVVAFSAGFTAPIAKLTEATQTISEGNFDVRLEENHEDEIGILARSMNTMSKKIQTLLIESIEKVKVDQEIAITSELQKNLIPPTDITQPKYHLKSHYKPAEKCGGDWWGYVETKEAMTLMIADATGHGLPSAMLTATTHGCFAAIQKFLTDFPDFKFSPSQMLGIANQVIVGSAKSELNMTMFIAQYHFESQTLTYSNAGHNWPYLITQSEGKAKLEVLRAAGQRLGESKDYEPPENHTIPFSEKDILLMYTDGLLENEDNGGKAYGKNRLKALLNAGAERFDYLAETLDSDLAQFYDGKTPQDDVTYVLFQKNELAAGNA